MQRFTFKANDHEFEFMCSSRNTRNGFAHDARVFIDGRSYPSDQATCNYINRTWESYCYQTVMQRLANAQATKYAARELDDYMKERGYKRMTAKRKNEFAQYLDENAGDLLRTWAELYGLIESHGVMEPPYPEWYGRRPRTFSPSYFA